MTATPPASDAAEVADLVVVGGGPAGLAAVRAYREGDGAGRVVLLTSEADAPYDRTALSKAFLRGEAEESDLPLEDPEFYRDREVELRTGVTARAIDRAGQQVVLDDGTVLGYRLLVLATGSEPVQLPVPGTELPEVLRLRSCESGRVLRRAAEQARSAVVIGSGFIACEAAASLARRGLAVTLVTDEPAPQANRLGPEVADRIRRWLVADGVDLRTERPVLSIEPRRVVVDDDEIETDLIVMAAGVRPRSELAEEAGLATESGRVVVDARMRTSDPAVFAVGDIALAYNTAAGRRLAVEHWGDAEAMGAVAGTVAAGGEAAWDSVPGFWTEIGDRTLMYAAWGDGFDQVVPAGSLAVSSPSSDGAFVVRYGQDGALVGVLSYEDEDAYEDGMSAIADGRLIASA